MERRAAALDRPARQLLRRDVEPVLSGEMFTCLAAAEEAPRLHDQSSAGMLNLRTMMIVFGGEGQNSNRLKSDHFEPCNGALRCIGDIGNPISSLNVAHRARSLRLETDAGA